MFHVSDYQHFIEHTTCLSVKGNQCFPSSARISANPSPSINPLPISKMPLLSRPMYDNIGQTSPPRDHAIVTCGILFIANTILACAIVTEITDAALTNGKRASGREKR